MTAKTFPELGTPIDIPWECPAWCSIDHESDGYLAHGHVVHRGWHPMTHSGDVGIWWSPIGTWREMSARVEIHLPFDVVKFDSGADLRKYASELAAIADRLDEMNAEMMA